MTTLKANHCPVCGKEIGWDDSDWDGDSITLMGTCECGLDVKQFEYCVAHAQAFIHPETKEDEYFELPTIEDRLDAEVKRLRAALEGLFEHCVMIHKRWGENSNQKQATEAIAKAKAALAGEEKE